MATKIVRVNRYWTGEGIPVRSDWGGFSGLSKNDLFEDKLSGKVYTFNGSTFDLNPFGHLSITGGGTGTGTAGKDATVQVGTITTATVPSTTPASVQIVDANPSTSDATLNFSFSIPKGEKGDQGEQGPAGPMGPAGPAGSGSGAPGKDATVNIGTVTTTTLPAGSQASVQVVDVNTSSSDATLNFTFAIPQGATGPQGPSGTGGGTIGVSPTRIYVIPNGVDDTANLQAALNEQRTTGKKIELAGTYKLSSGLVIAKDHLFVNIEGWAKLQAINQNPWTFFSSPVPASTAEAEGQYTQRKIKMSNLILQGWGKQQTGIDLFAWEGAKFEQIWGGELKRFMDVTFGLRTIIEECEANGCTDGFIIRSGAGRWADATTSNSCSNGTTLSHCRVYCAGTNVGIGIYDASGCVIDYPVVEGGSVNRGIDYASMSPTSTGLKLYRYDF